MRRLPPATVGRWSHNGRAWVLRVDGRIVATLTRKWPPGRTLVGVFSGKDRRPLAWGVNDGAGWPVQMPPGTRRQAMARAEQHAVWYAAQPEEHRKLLDLPRWAQLRMFDDSTLVMGEDGVGNRTGYIVAAPRPQSWGLIFRFAEDATAKASVA